MSMNTTGNPGSTIRFFNTKLIAFLTTSKPLIQCVIDNIESPIKNIDFVIGVMRELLLSSCNDAFIRIYYTYIYQDYKDDIYKENEELFKKSDIIYQFLSVIENIKSSENGKIKQLLNKNSQYLNVKTARIAHRHGLETWNKFDNNTKEELWKLLKILTKISEIYVSKHC